MKTDRKTKAAKSPPAVKTVKGGRRAVSKTNGKHPLAAYEHIPVGIVEASLDGKYIDVNEEFCRILGYSRQELLRLGIKECTHEEDYSVDAKLYQQLIAGKIPFYRLEERGLRKGGGEVWVELTRTLVYDAKGKPHYTVGVVLDISDRKDVERVLRDSVERLRLATGAAEMFMWEWDFQSQTYTLADNFEQVLGFSAGLLPRNKFETLWALSPEEDVRRISESFEKAVENQSDLYALPCRVINPENGQIVWLEISAKIVYDQAGTPERMFGVAQNITESKNIQDEISIISRVPQENPNPVMRLKPEGKVVYANPASAALLEDWMRGVQPAIPEELLKTITQAFTSDRKMEVEIGHHGKHFSFTVAPIIDSGYVNLYGKDITQRKQAEEKLRESEERFRALVSQATAGISESDLDGRLVFVNRCFCELLGYSEAELLGKTIWEVTHPEDLEENKRLFNRMLEQGEPFQFEKRFIRKDGSTLWASVSVTNIHDSAGKPKGGVGVVLDLEKRKQAETALAEYARQQEALYRLSDHLHRTESLADVYDAALDAILNALQCDRASILLCDDSEVMHFVAWRGLSDAYRRATDGHSPWKPDVKEPQPVVMDDIRTADLDDSLRAVVQREGIGALAFIPLVINEKLIGKFMIYYNSSHVFEEAELDLSLTIAHQLAFGIDRKRAEVQLRGSEERFRTLANVMPSIVWTAAPDGTITYANDQWFHYAGITPEENAKHWPELVLHPDDYERCIREWTHALETVPDEYLIEVRNRRYDGQYRWFQTRAVPVRDASGKALAWYGVTTDIHERIEAEHRLSLLAEISEMLRNVEDPHELMYSISKALGEHLQVKRVLFNEIDLEHDREIVHRDYHNGLESVAGVHKVSDYSSLASAEMAAGKTVVNVDSKTDPRTARDYQRTYALSGERSYVVVPMMRANHWVASLWVSDDTPRTWTKEEVSLLETIAERTWTVIEKLRINAELRESEERLRATLETTVVGFATLSTDMRFMEVNDAFCNIVGYSREELLSMNGASLTHPDFIESTNQHVAQLLAGEIHSFVLEKIYVRKDGTQIWVQNSVSMMRGTDGKPLSLIVICQDVTERKQAEQALRRNIAFDEAVMNSMGEGLYTVDNQGKVVFMNPAAEKLFGWTLEELRGRKIHDITHYQHRDGTPFPAEECAGLHVLRTGNPLTGYQDVFIRKDGTFFDVTYSSSPLRGEDGSITGLVMVFEDTTEQKRYEQALRQSEERFARFMQHLPGLAWIKDVEGHYVYANAAAEKAFNTPREVLYGKTDEEIFPPEEVTQFKQNDQRALMEGEGVQVVETLKHQDGILHHSLVTKFMIPGPDGNTTLIGGTAFDITERLRADEALRESEERFRALLNQATAGIVCKDANGRLIFVNQAFCNMLGRAEEELLGKTVWDFMHDEDIVENKRSYERLMLEGIPFKLERRLIREDGSVIWVDASVSPIMDAEGKPQSAVAVEVDITGRKHAEEALRQLNLQLEDRILSRTAKLRAVNQTFREEIKERKKVEEALRKSEAAARENEEKLSTLFNLLPVGISFLDLQGHIIQMNPALENILKLSKEQVADQSYRSRKYIRANGTLMPPAEFASQRAVTNRKTVYNVETGVLLEEGELVWTSVSAAPVDVADVGAVVVTVDITESKRAERALQDSRERLQILSQRLVEVQEDERRAIARELHDRVGQTLAALNINLIIISGQLEGKVDEQTSTRLNDSMKLVAETIALVRDVMSNLRPAVLDDYGLEAAIESHLSQYMARYEIQSKFEKPASPLPRLGPSIEMTFLRIAQEALMNIAKHARASQVTLRLQKEEKAVRMIIQDNGIGIDWQEADQTGSHGLTIMRERAEAFGGSLRVNSTPGKGTTVEVRIPIENNNPPQVQQEMS